MTWEGISIPMRDFNRLSKWKLSKYKMQVIIQEMRERIVTKEATDQMIKILYSNYRKADLKQVIKGAKHLKSSEKEKLYALLVKYEELFDGTLGRWETSPVDFELIKGATPHSQRHYPIPHL